MDHRHSKVINGSLAVKAASVRVVSRRKQIENGSLSSVRQAAAACNVSPPVVRRWLSLRLAGLDMIRRSATAAAGHRRNANTAFRAVAADNPASSIFAAHARTAALLIWTGGVVPNRGSTLPSHRRTEPRPGRRAQVVPGLDPLRRPHS